ncbi:MAG: glutathione peroxidase [Verrucomicrobiaceae bacterium]|nr:glutathione peroxidase [Verrucomicrobiaceae bacterium]
MSNALSQISFKKMDGSDASLSDYTGSVVLIVNVASACGLTPQYEGLEKLYEANRERGLVVLGFPANNFGAQEPGSNDEIVEFCRGNFGVQFPLAQKISVTGDDTHPLYRQLVAAKPKAEKNADSQLLQILEKNNLAPKNDTDVMWNFEKFLVNRKGEVVNRFAPDIAPEDERIAKAVEAELAKS